MERPELTDGLKHAIDRGYSLDIAVSSFINAGYNRQDVIDSAKPLSGSILVPEIKTQQFPKPAANIIPQIKQQIFSPQQTLPQQTTQTTQIITEKKKVNIKILLLIVLLIVLLGALALVILAKDTILSMFG